MSHIDAIRVISPGTGIGGTIPHVCDNASEEDLPEATPRDWLIAACVALSMVFAGGALSFFGLQFPDYERDWHNKPHSVFMLRDFIQAFPGTPYADKAADELKELERLAYVAQRAAVANGLQALKDFAMSPRYSGTLAQIEASTTLANPHFAMELIDDHYDALRFYGAKQHRDFLRLYEHNVYARARGHVDAVKQRLQILKQAPDTVWIRANEVRTAFEGLNPHDEQSLRTFLKEFGKDPVAIKQGFVRRIIEWQERNQWERDEAKRKREQRSVEWSLD